VILAHYYHKDDNPFQSLSSLAEEEALHVIANLQGRNGAVYRRFCDPEKYLRQRQETENWLRNEFIRNGEEPIYTYPQYFVVEQSVWIEEGYNGQSCIVQLPLSAFNPKHVSFTYPDSMISYWLKDQADKVFYRSEYHGQVFVSSEIRKIINEFGIPHEEWRTEEVRRYDLFIEAQVWVNLS
jgi:hypothetical protein